ncbi:MAG TPA: addiction module protein [Fimbriiglobus sp.]|jgi:putative addiction module component (TIGR02574 family)
MPVTMQSLGIDQLTIEEKLSLVHEIWDDIVDHGPNPSLTDAQRTELRRRVAEDDTDPDAALPWEEVYSSIVRRYSV